MEDNLWRSTQFLMVYGPKGTFSHSSVSQLTELELSQCSRVGFGCEVTSLINEEGGSHRSVFFILTQSSYAGFFGLYCTVSSNRRYFLYRKRFHASTPFKKSVLI